MNYQQYSPQRFSYLPKVVKNLLIINGLFYLATFSMGRVFGIDITDILGLHYFGAEKFQPYQFITYMFLHDPVNFAHILFNMFALWMFGYALENLWGPKRFLIYYLVTGIGAALVHYAVFYFEMAPRLTEINNYINNPDLYQFKSFVEQGWFRVSNESMRHFSEFLPTYNHLVVTDTDKLLRETVIFMNQYKQDFLNAPVVIGASGAVFGILLAFGMTFPNALIYIYFAIPIRAKWFVIIYGLLELYAGFSADDNVAHFAHLGGMLFGFFLIKYWQNKRKTNYFE